MNDMMYWYLCWIISSNCFDKFVNQIEKLSTQLEYTRKHTYQCIRRHQFINLVCAFLRSVTKMRGRVDSVPPRRQYKLVGLAPNMDISKIYCKKLVLSLSWSFYGCFNVLQCARTHLWASIVSQKHTKSHLMSIQTLIFSYINSMQISFFVQKIHCRYFGIQSLF